MLYYFRLLLFLLNVDQSMLLTWFNNDLYTTNIDFNTTNIFDTWQNVTINDPVYKLTEYLAFLTNTVGQEIRNGFGLTEVENVVFFFIFMRFIILLVRYNLRVATYITCTCILAGYVWYQHLIYLITVYDGILYKIPYLAHLQYAEGPGSDDLEFANANQNAMSEVYLLTNPVKLFCYTIAKGIIKTDPNTGLQNYIDPFSMMLSNLNETNKAKFLPYYYQIYNVVLPRMFEAINAFWLQLIGIVAYTLIVRVGKRYCPYLIRWHWTLLLMFNIPEVIIQNLLYRVVYFQDNILQPQIVYNPLTETINENVTDPIILLQFKLLTFCIGGTVALHMVATLLALLHAVWGQYFYFPFFVENTELHLGPRPKNTVFNKKMGWVYSGGKTAWQDYKRINVRRKFPKLWYGLFGRGSENGFLYWLFEQFKYLLFLILTRLKLR
nr:hypothetical protein Ycf90 [Pseudo-nitzschia hainanensis]